MWRNTRLNNREYRDRRTVLKSLPQTVFIDTGNVCNLRCELCPSGLGKIDKKRLMSLEMFKRAAAALGPTARQIHLYNWGEPMLNSDIVEMCRIAARFPAKTYIATNLNVLKPGQAQGLARSGLDVLNVSVDGATQESYEAYRAGGVIEKVLANMREVVRAVRDCPGSRLKVRWQFLTSRKNQHEVEDARRIADDIGVKFKARRMRVGLEEFDEKSIFEAAEADDQWLPEAEELNRYKTEEAHEVCCQLWNTAVVNFDGSITPCCQIYKESQAFSDSFEDQFRRIWNGPSYVAAREMFATGEVSPRAAKLVCNPCRRLGNVL